MAYTFSRCFLLFLWSYLNNLSRYWRERLFHSSISTPFSYTHKLWTGILKRWKLFRLHRGEKRVQISSINRDPGKWEQKQVHNPNQLNVCLFSKEQQPDPAVGNLTTLQESSVSASLTKTVLPERQKNYVYSLSGVMNCICSLKWNVVHCPGHSGWMQKSGLADGHKNLCHFLSFVHKFFCLLFAVLTGFLFEL